MSIRGIVILAFVLMIIWLIITTVDVFSSTDEVDKDDEKSADEQLNGFKSGCGFLAIQIAVLIILLIFILNFLKGCGC